MSVALAARPISLLLAFLVLALPSTASASGMDVIDDCMDDSALSRKYTQAEYKQALADLPADSDAYTDCRDIIKRARLAKAAQKSDAGSSSGGSGAGTTTTISNKKKAKIKRQLSGNDLVTDAPLQIGNAVVKPGSLQSSSAIPAPLLAVLILTLLGAAGAAAIAIRRIVLSRRNR